MENKNVMSQNTLVWIVGSSCCLGIALPLFVLYRRGVPSYLLWSAGSFGLIFSVFIILMGLKRREKLAALNERLPAPVQKTFRKIARVGLFNLVIGGFLSATGRPFISLLWIAAGLGLVMKKEWGRRLSIGLASFHVVSIGFAFVSGKASKIIQARIHHPSYVYIGIALGITLLVWEIYFLMQPEIREALKLARKTPELEKGARGT